MRRLSRLLLQARGPGIHQCRRLAARATNAPAKPVPRSAQQEQARRRATPKAASEVLYNWGCALQRILLSYASPHPANKAMIRCNLSTLMGRDKLRISDVVRETGLNRSTITALYKETATRVDLPAIDLLCRLFRCQVGELFEHLPEAAEERP